MSRPYQGFSTLRTPQSRPVPGSSQVENSAGGFSWEIDKWERLRRFLILGAEGGTYYIGEQKLVEENAQALIECVAEDGHKTVTTIAEISAKGRAPKNDPALFALAYAMANGDVATRRYAAAQLPNVARTGYHLFVFAGYLTQFRGWGRVAKRAVADWYTEKNSDELAYQVVKYRQREGFSHRRLLNVSHPVPVGKHASILAFAHGDVIGMTEIPRVIYGYLKAKDEEDVYLVAKIVREYGLTWEMVPTEMLNSPVVYEALLETMPVMATIRNLPKLTEMGLVGPQRWDLTEMVVERIQEVKGAKVHPMQVLLALRTYASGQGFRGGKTWKPVSQIVEALDSAFYKAFDNVEPTGKTIVLGLDVSGSMGMHYIANSPLTVREAAVAMAMVTAKVEPRVVVLAFSNQLVQIDLNKATSLNDAVTQTSRIPFGGTDCSLPMVEATQQRFGVDCFQVYTDNETWAGKIHPAQALEEHRRKMQRPNAKSVVVGMVSNGFTIADPNDPRMLDVVGFDTTVPAVMADFVRD